MRAGTSDLAPGERLGDWRITRFIGAGQYGRVYEATYEPPWWRHRDPAMPVRSALKVFEASLLYSPQSQAALTDEAKAMRSISHRNVLRLYDDLTMPRHSKYAGTRLFVLELGECDLQAEASRTGVGLPDDQVTEIARDMLSGLDAVHRVLLHGDIKPENIIRVGDQHKIADMGVAVRLERNGAYPRTGTMRYRPPEWGERTGTRPLTEGQVWAGLAYDIWCLGVTLHEALLLRHPYEPHDRRLEDEAIFVAVRSEPAPVIEAKDPTLKRVIERCLDRDHTTRADIGELLAILEPELVSVRIGKESDRPVNTILYDGGPVRSPDRVGVDDIDAAGSRAHHRGRLGTSRPLPAEGRTRRSPIRGRTRLALSVLALVVVLAVVVAGLASVTHRFPAGFYVAAPHGGPLVIYDGPPNGFAWFDGDIVETTNTGFESLEPSPTTQQLRNGIRTGTTLESARAYVRKLPRAVEPGARTDAQGGGAESGGPTTGDGAGVCTAQSPSARVGENQIKNSSFENILSGWNEYNSRITRVELAEAPEGASVAKVTRVAQAFYSLNDHPGTIQATTGGQVYRAAAFVSAASPSAEGKFVTLVMRENKPDNTDVAQWTSGQVELTSAFRMVVASGAAVASGNHMGMYIQQNGAASGDAFYADGLSMAVVTCDTQGAETAGQAIPVPTPAPSSTTPPTTRATFPQRFLSEDGLPAADRMWIDVAAGTIHVVTGGRVCVAVTGVCLPGGDKRGSVVILLPSQSYELTNLTPTQNWHGAYYGSTDQWQLLEADRRGAMLTPGNCTGQLACDVVDVLVIGPQGIVEQHVSRR